MHIIKDIQLNHLIHAEDKDGGGGKFPISLSGERSKERFDLSNPLSSQVSLVSRLLRLSSPAFFPFS